MQKVRKGVKKMKDKDYYTKSYDKYSQNTKYQCDLEEGKIRIYEVPFEYRDGLAYVLARKAIRLGDLKRECRKKEKRLLAEQLMGDIIVCKKYKEKGSDLSSEYPEYRTEDRIRDLRSLFLMYADEGYF